MVSDGFVCMMRAKRDMLLVSSEAFSGSMMSERWDFRREAGDNGVKLDAGIKGCRFMSSCVRWRFIEGVACGGVVARESQFLAKQTRAEHQTKSQISSIVPLFQHHKQSHQREGLKGL